jgi:hypothetical protein
MIFAEDRRLFFTASLP